MEEAITVDLLRMGRSIHELGYSMSWIELRAVINHAGPCSELAKLGNPLSEYNSPELMLLRVIGDSLLGANWQRGGGKGARPTPIYEQLKRALRSEKQDRQAPKNLSEIEAIRAALLARKKQKT